MLTYEMLFCLVSDQGNKIGSSFYKPQNWNINLNKQQLDYKGEPVEDVFNEILEKNGMKVCLDDIVQLYNMYEKSLPRYTTKGATRLIPFPRIDENQMSWEDSIKALDTWTVGIALVAAIIMVGPRWQNTINAGMFGDKYFWKNGGLVLKRKWFLTKEGTEIDDSRTLEQIRR